MMMKIFGCLLTVLLAVGCGGSSSQNDGGSDGDGDGGSVRLVAIEVTPTSLELEVGAIAQLEAVGTYSDDSTDDITGEAEWIVDPTSVVSVSAGQVTALEVGEASVHAYLDYVSSDPVTVTVKDPAHYEARGVWVTRWNYSSAADVQSIVDNLAAGGFNQMYFQVRGTADAYYQSSVEPWASGLSGVLGRDPGWDPLQTAIDLGHAAGLQVHAWINTFPCWNCGAALPQSEGIPHVLESHPEWVAADSNGVSMIGCTDGYISLSPGIPGVREHIRLVAEDIFRNYDVDGIHLDYIRYPGAQYSHDATSEAAFAEAQIQDPGLSWEDWQRRQVNLTVEGVFETLMAERPDAALSAAVWFIRQNVWGWSAVSEGYHQYYQDPWAWTQGGYIDAVAPMIYFPLTDPPGERLDFRSMLQDHLSGNADRYVYAGIHGDYSDFSEIENEIAVGRELGAKGFVIFAYVYIINHDFWNDFAQGPLTEEAVPPLLVWR
jgi:uncharacterized lipoprotein YddW (UPF0748 family)